MCILFRLLPPESAIKVHPQRSIFVLGLLNYSTCYHQNIRPNFIHNPLFYSLIGYRIDPDEGDHLQDSLCWKSHLLCLPKQIQSRVQKYCVEILTP